MQTKTINNFAHSYFRNDVSVHYHVQLHLDNAFGETGWQWVRQTFSGEDYSEKGAGDFGGDGLETDNIFRHGHLQFYR